MHNKAQGALEYLLLIGGAVLVAAVVIVVLLGISNTSQNQEYLNTAAGFCTQKNATLGTAGGATCTSSVCVNKLSWNCAGTYPNCTGTKTATPC